MSCNAIKRQIFVILEQATNNRYDGDGMLIPCIIKKHEKGYMRFVGARASQ